MNLYTGQPVPFDGKRKLTGREAQQRAKALACVRSTSVSCQGQVHIGLFFDGTGNNYEWDDKVGDKRSQKVRNKHSNVGRLWEAHFSDPTNGYFKTYVHGVGTPFDAILDSSTWGLDKGGAGFGLMGSNRINYGILSVFKALAEYAKVPPILTSDEEGALIFGASMVYNEDEKRWLGFTAVEERLAISLKKCKKKILQVNVSIFGFSRGAAQARTCAHWLAQLFERGGGGFQIAGIPIRIGFMGIFDTVAAVGVGDVTPFTEGHMAWADGTQAIHPVVEQCAHFIALHEQRASFALESSTGRGNVGYPGMHSDVGGGYLPNEQGKSMDAWGGTEWANLSPHLSQIPLLDMHFAALKAGVPLMTIDELRKSDYKKSFAISEHQTKAYNNWLAQNGIPASDVTSFTQAHCRQYIRYRGDMLSGMASKLTDKQFFKDANSGDRKDLLKANQSLSTMLRSWGERRLANATITDQVRERAKTALRLTAPFSGLFIDDGKAPLNKKEEQFYKIFMEGPTLPLACTFLFDNYVHDSRAGFYPVPGIHEPQSLLGGYARFRTVFTQEEVKDDVFVLANQAIVDAKAAANQAVESFDQLRAWAGNEYDRARAKVAAAKRAAKAKLDKAGDAVGEYAYDRVQELKQAEKDYLDTQRRIIERFSRAEIGWQTNVEKRWVENPPRDYR